MTNDKLKRGGELRDLIEITENALKGLMELDARGKPCVAGENYQGPVGNIYNLSIFEYSDGSGLGGNLNRLEGNDELLKLIIVELQRQLQDFKTEFDKL
jgi:hypothetical protein